MVIRAFLAALLTLPLCAAPKAKNVIIFLSDAGGIPTMNAASIHGYDAPQKLYVQSWPNMGLSDTSPAANWVTDSAAGMTAIVTGVKTKNGVISQGPEAVRGKQDGRPLKTILEYAEEHGLSTGVVTNMSIADATPAACYAHASDRGLWGKIFLDVFQPRFGDGVDVVLGAGRVRVYDQVAGLNKDLDEVARAAKRPVYSTLAEIPAGTARPIAVLEKDMDVPAAAHLALSTLAKNKKGYFLMIEWDTHADNPQKGLDAMVGFDKLVREIAGKVDLKETLLVFTADHSFNLRSIGGKPGTPLLTGFEEWKKTHKPADEIRIPALHVGHQHTGEEVLVAAQGPGSDKVRGFMPNTRIFEIMMAAYGWKADSK